MLREMTNEYPTDVFFVDVLAVPPPKARPCQFTGGMMTIHPQSTGLQYVVETVAVMKQILQVLKGADLELMKEEAREMIKTTRGETLQVILYSFCFLKIGFLPVFFLKKFFGI